MAGFHGTSLIKTAGISPAASEPTSLGRYKPTPPLPGSLLHTCGHVFCFLPNLCERIPTNTECIVCSILVYLSNTYCALLCKAKSAFLPYRAYKVDIYNVSADDPGINNTSNLMRD